MSALVISCGRTGTNIGLAILSGNSNLNADPSVENKSIFKNLKTYGPKYLAKSDTTYLDNYQQLISLMGTNPKLKLIWTVRDPRDVLLSKIRRGQPNKMGGDNNTGQIYADATPKGAIESLRKMYNTFQRVEKDYKDRVFLVMMEDMVLETEKISKALCEFLDIPYEESMVNFPSRIQNQYKKKRYGNKIDEGQVALWKNWEVIYDGFFVNNKYDMEETFSEVDDMISFFGYDNT